MTCWMLGCAVGKTTDEAIKQSDAILPVTTIGSGDSTGALANGTGTSAGGGEANGAGGGAANGTGGSGGAGAAGGTGATGGEANGAGGAGGTGGGAANGTGGSGGAGAASGAGGSLPACATDADCDDGAFCNGAETCDQVTGCVAGTAPLCDDNVGCTDDSCDSSANACAHTANDAACSNGKYCDGAESCDLLNGCQPGTSPTCDDNNSCTADICDEALKGCLHAPDDMKCDDGVFCNGAESCDLVMGCLAGATPSCDDGIACSSDFCNVASDACGHAANDAFCSNGSFCDGVESCNLTLGCQPGTAVECNDGVDCTSDSCDNAQASCVYAPNDAACQDGSFCNGEEYCAAGVGCQAGTPVACGDAYSCTADSCSDALGKCVAVPNDAACQDGSFCNGVEKCDPQNSASASGCASGAPVSCSSDGVSCTHDECSDNKMACDNVADDGACAAGQLCVPAKGGCIEAKACNSGVDCQDGNLCNGIEICDTALHICQAGTPKICNDGIACTGDSCDANTGNCVYVANDAQCDDGLACNGVEQCSPSSGCVVGTTVNCNDGVSCTLDSCNEPTGTCSHVAQNAVCNDGFFCNGTEVCDVQAGCVDGTPPTCSDGISCTTDVCDIMFDKCVGVADDSKCPCAQSCDPTQGCGNFCQVTTCQGKTYDCGNCLDDDGDCKVDQGDEMCLGPCDNSETGFDLAIPGGNNAPCKQDCYFDGDTGAGNDGCYWSHSCDPYEVAPNYDPEGSKCAYDPMAGIPGTGLGCAEAFAAQAPSCLGVCGPLTPNGCDCFGCCLVPGAAEPVWLGSKDSKDTPTCTLDALDDPSKCRPCTQVEACLNTCDTCELCVGKYELPAECQCQICPVGAQMCGAPCGTPCPFGEFCNSGCCVAAP